MPALGADMTEATLLEWHVGIGEWVHRGDILATVDTAKSAIDIEALQDGAIESLVVSPGTIVTVGTVIATLADRFPARSVREPSVPIVGTVPTVPIVGTVPPVPGRVPSSPLARRRAVELGVDLSSMAPSAETGMIGAREVERAAARRPQVDHPAPEAQPSPPAASVGSMREVIGSLMARAKREIPHFSLQSTIDLEAALTRLESANAHLPISDRILPAAVLLRAVARAARANPQLNGWFDQGFQPADHVHLATAISLRKAGLIAPAILDADRLDLASLMAAMKDLVNRARAGRLRASELTASTITATILGDQGAEVVTGIIFPPQVALVGFGRIVRRPAAVDGMLAVHRQVTVTLAADHRVIDGHLGSRFLQDVQDGIDQWEVA